MALSWRSKLKRRPNLFGKYLGAEVRIAEQNDLILREDEIIGILNRNGKSAGKK
jgi:hypothetical protein